MKLQWLINHVTKREPDLYIGGKDDPYLIRWYVIPRNKYFNIYLHHFMRSDDDRARHTHPWLWNLSILLDRKYREWFGDTASEYRDVKEGSWKFRVGPAAHRIELIDGPVWTLFITGQWVREWGFLCKKGFVHWKDFSSGGHGEVVGKGCE